MASAINSKLLETALNHVKKLLIDLIEPKSGKKAEIRQAKNRKKVLILIRTAIERMIPSNALMPLDYEGYSCPRCCHHLNGMPSYCSHCGQKLSYPKDDGFKESITKVNTIVAYVSKENDDIVMEINSMRFRFEDYDALMNSLESQSGEVDGVMEYRSYEINH